jgi:hypothetical protein
VPIMARKKDFFQILRREATGSVSNSDVHVNGICWRTKKT